MLLFYRDSFKVALIEVDAYPDEERIVERHAVKGEEEALSLARRVLAQHRPAGEGSE